MAMEPLRKTLLVFGLGYVGSRFSVRLLRDGWDVSAVVRAESQFSAASALGASPILFGDEARLKQAISMADAVLVTAPPSQNGCPALISMHSGFSAGNKPRWLGYLSSTSVYGDQGCRPTDETTEFKATSPEGRARIESEKAWGAFTHTKNLSLNTFRLAAIYGPGRSAIDRVRAGTARAVVKPGHVISRIHVDDIVSLLVLSIQKCDWREMYNVSDDEPAPPQDVIAYATRILNVPPPPKEKIEDVQMSAAWMRFFSDCKRVSALRAKQRLGWKPDYPTYRQGLEAIMAASRCNY